MNKDEVFIKKVNTLVSDMKLPLIDDRVKEYVNVLFIYESTQYFI